MGWVGNRFNLIRLKLNLDLNLNPSLNPQRNPNLDLRINRNLRLKSKLSLLQVKKAKDLSINWIWDLIRMLYTNDRSVLRPYIFTYHVDPISHDLN